jgi:hypothetical protein
MADNRADIVAAGNALASPAGFSVLILLAFAHNAGLLQCIKGKHAG